MKRPKNQLFTPEELSKIVVPKMTVNEASILLRRPQNVLLNFGFNIIPFDSKKKIDRELYGDFIVSYISACSAGSFEIGIRTTPNLKDDQALTK